MLYRILLVGTTFDTVPRFDTSMTLISRFIDTIAFVNNNYIFLENIIIPTNVFVMCFFLGNFHSKSGCVRMRDHETSLIDQHDVPQLLSFS